MKKDWNTTTLQDLLPTNFVLPQTKAVLQQRLETPDITKPSFFSVEEFITLQAVCNRLLPQPLDRKNKIDIGGIFDTHLSKGKASNGWRYNALPPDEVMYKQGLQAIEQSAQSLYGKAFQELEMNVQDELLTSVQNKMVDGGQWQQLPSDLFFIELFSSLVEIYYSHPFGKDEIGDRSYADAKGWHQIGLNEMETTDLDMTQQNNEA